MKHDEHFLERLSRVDEQCAALSLRLYQDSGLVHDIVRFAGHANAERVALAISGGDEPPHLVVARNGHFVTCLASGMKLDIPVVPWSVVRDGLHQRGAARRIQSASRKELRAMFLQGIHRGGRVAREDFAPLCAVVPIDRKTWYIDWVKRLPRYQFAAGRLQKAARRNKASDADHLELWRQHWELAHRAVLLLVADPEAEWMRRNGLHRDLVSFMLTVDGVVGGAMPTAARFVWTLAQMGGEVADVLLHERAESEWPGVAGLCGLALGALALRHPAWRKPVCEALARPFTCADDEDAPEGLVRWSDVQHLEAQVVALLGAPKSTRAAFLERTAAWALARLRATRGDEAERFRADDVLALALASAAPSKDASSWLSGLVGFLPALAQAGPLDLYLPRAWMPAAVDEAAMARAVLGRAVPIREEPVVAPPKRGRNALCPCGSGKKAKHCCGT